MVDDVADEYAWKHAVIMLVFVYFFVLVCFFGLIDKGRLESDRILHASNIDGALQGSVRCMFWCTLGAIRCTRKLAYILQ